MYYITKLNERWQLDLFLNHELQRYDSKHRSWVPFYRIGVPLPENKKRVARG